MRFKCVYCCDEVTNISVSKTYEVRDDYEKHPSSGEFLKGPHDREYFHSTVNALYYKCSCGERSVRSIGNNLQDFIRDSERIEPNDLKIGHYGSLSNEIYEPEEATEEDQTKMPRPLSLVRVDLENTIPKNYHDSYPFKHGNLMIFIGVIPNMPGHCIVMSHPKGEMYAGYHIEYFTEVDEDE